MRGFFFVLKCPVYGFLSIFFYNQTTRNKMFMTNLLSFGNIDKNYCIFGKLCYYENKEILGRG